MIFYSGNFWKGSWAWNFMSLDASQISRNLTLISKALKYIPFLGNTAVSGLSLIYKIAKFDVFAGLPDSSPRVIIRDLALEIYNVIKRSEEKKKNEEKKSFFYNEIEKYMNETFSVKDFGESSLDSYITTIIKKFFEYEDLEITENEKNLIRGISNNNDNFRKFCLIVSINFCIQAGLIKNYIRRSQDYINALPEFDALSEMSGLYEEVDSGMKLNSAQRSEDFLRTFFEAREITNYQPTLENIERNFFKYMDQQTLPLIRKL